MSPYVFNLDEDQLTDDASLLLLEWRSGSESELVACLADPRFRLRTFPVAIEEFTRLEGVSEKTKAKILWDNCARLYDLG